MRITEEFGNILRYALAKNEEKDEKHEQVVRAIEILANEAAIKIIYALSDSTDSEIRDFLYELKVLGEIEEYHVAIEILSRFFVIAGLREMSYLIDGFIAGNRWEGKFLEELVEFGSDHCFFRSIGLEY